MMIWLGFAALFCVVVQTSGAKCNLANEKEACGHEISLKNIPGASKASEI